VVTSPGPLEPLKPIKVMVKTPKVSSHIGPKHYLKVRKEAHDVGTDYDGSLVDLDDRDRERKEFDELKSKHKGTYKASITKEESEWRQKC
jgi:hypothetical protein